MVRMGNNAKEIIIPKMDMDGLKNYTRNSGYTAGRQDSHQPLGKRLG